MKLKFPLLRLPLELRQEILLYLLPKTNDLVDSNPLARHAREFSAVKKRSSKGMAIPTAETEAARQIRKGVSNVVWLRGNTALFAVCRQLHDECADLVYGRGTFLLFLTYAGIKWRYRFLLPSGMAPTRNYDFLDLMPERYMRLLKRVIVNVDHVDAYTGMIKFNVSGKGLTHGLRRQVQRLVNVLKSMPLPNTAEDGAKESQDEVPEERHLSSLRIRVSNSNAISEALDRQRNSSSPPKVTEDLELMLEPLRQLYGVREATVTGAVADEFARDLEASLRNTERPALSMELVMVDDVDPLTAPVAGLCVYGNDI